jgi:hypothetical protein
MVERYKKAVGRQHQIKSYHLRLILFFLLKATSFAYLSAGLPDRSGVEVSKSSTGNP